MKKKYCALMPMKGHSERVPNKNIRPIAGKPLCLWMLEVLSQIVAITRIAVDTDSEEIASLVELTPKVKVIPRPEALRGDFVSMNRVLAHDMAQLEDYEDFIQTHATNPLLLPETVEKAIGVYENSACDSVMSVTRHQARFYTEDRIPVNHDPNTLIRTQDLPALFEENSNFYIFSRRSFAVSNARIGAKPLFCEVPRLEAVDIDEPEDWLLAKMLLERRAGVGESV